MRRFSGQLGVAAVITLLLWVVNAQEKGFSQEKKQYYMHACANEVALEEYCECVFDELSQEITEAEYAELLLKSAEGDSAPLMALSVKIGKKCLSKLPESYNLL